MSILTDAIAPILTDLSVARTDCLEFKSEINAVNSKIAAHQATLNLARERFEKTKSLAISQDFLLYSDQDFLRRQVEYMGNLNVEKRRCEWIFQISESYYIGLESNLKAKILEAGGTESLYPTYVPARPFPMSERQVTGARQLAIDAAAMNEIDGFNNGFYDAVRLPAA